MPTDTDLNADEEPKRWNFHPGAPVKYNPLFDWPPNPVGVIRWYSAFWLQISTTTLCFAFAVVIYFTLLPPLADMTSFAPGWMLRVWLANLIPHCLCAGILHHWLYNKRGQGKTFEYDAREMAKDNGTFSFRNQVRDNMFWTIVSGITIWTAFNWLVFWGMANGYAPVFFFPENPVWFVLWFVLIPGWSSFHFYWVHRALHWPPLYRLAHALHHRNVNVGPWSGISMHPIEHALFFTNFLIHFIVPSHPLHLLFHGYVQATHPVFSHSGFDKLVVQDKTRARMGVFFHQLHHKYFECNYGTVEMPWDRWFGSYHDGSDAATRDTRARKKQMYG